MSPDRHARTMLPIPDRPAPGLTTYDAKDPDTAFPPIEPLLPPKGAPNVLVVLLDDVGFGSSTVFGGPCRMPTAERLAAGGLRYNRFHTCALCAPTRAALLSGRNHHSVGMGSITETATSAPGNSSLRPNTKAPLAMTLKLNGYSTAQFGKCHEVPVWQSSPMGPFDAWPSGGGGFETFYGFIGGENNQWDPALYDGTTPVEPPATAEEGYHLTEDLTDRAVSWVRQQKALMPDKPFFVYLAYGAAHAPHHVAKEWADGYAGEFDDGWDAQRERIFARQKELGVIPADAELTARHAEIPAWDDMPDELKPVLARQMEVFAGFLEHTDHHVGRVIDALEDLEILDDTIIYYIIGDNGASAEGTLNGAFNEMANFNGMAALETPEFMISKMDEFGSPSSYNHYSVGWAWAMDTPFQWTKQVASHWGGTRNGTIVHWPRRDRGEGWPAQPVHPRHRRGPDDPRSRRAARADHGERCACSRRWRAPACSTPSTTPTPRSATTCSTSRCSPTAASTTRAGARSPSTARPGSWSAAQLPAFDDDVWELYDGSTDYSQAHNLAAEHPEMLAKLQRLWLIEAVKYNVLPMDDRTSERFEPSHGRATDAHPWQLAAVLRRHGPALGEQRRQHQEQVVLRHRRGRRPRRRRQRRDHRPRRPLRRMGGLRQGRQGQVRLQHARHPRVRHRRRHPDPRRHPPGAHGVRLRRRRAGQGRRRHPLLRRRTPSARGRVEHTQPMIFSADETTDIGYESGTTVTPDYTAQTSRFTGKIHWVQLDLGTDDHDHFIDPEERLRIAMARQ